MGKANSVGHMDKKMMEMLFERWNGVLRRLAQPPDNKEIETYPYEVYQYHSLIEKRKWLEDELAKIKEELKRRDEKLSG